MTQQFDITEELKRLELCTCILAVSDRLYLKSLREMLRVMNIRNVETCGDGSQAIFILQQIQEVDLVIAQEDLPIQDGLEIVRFVRLDRAWLRPELPILTIGWKWTRQKISAYRDAGVDDVVVFPASQHVMQRRILSALYSKRPFIFTDNFRGPDRRRHGSAEFHGPFRRQDDEMPQQSVDQHRNIFPLLESSAPPPPVAGAMSQVELLESLRKKDKP